MIIKKVLEVAALCIGYFIMGYFVLQWTISVLEAIWIALATIFCMIYNSLKKDPRNWRRIKWWLVPWRFVMLVYEHFTDGGSIRSLTWEFIQYEPPFKFRRRNGRSPHDEFMV